MTTPDALQATPRLLPIYFDKVFRLLFDDSHDARILISFLNAILHLEGDRRIASLTLTPREVQGFLADDKEVVLDIVASDLQQRQFSVEMQVNPQGFYRARALFYACGLFHSQLSQGQPYSVLKPVYAIHLLCFNLWPEAKVPRIHSLFELRDRHDFRPFDELLELHILELEKLPWNALDIGFLKTLDLESAWLYLIRHGHELSKAVVADSLPPELQDAYGRLEMVSREPDLQRAYMLYEKAKRDKLAYIPDLMEESRLKGVQEGKAEGRMEGKAEGLLEGKAEGLLEGTLKTLTALRDRGLLSPEAFEQEKAQLLASLASE